MNGLFSAYRVALIDSSFYFRPFSLELREALKGIKVYVGRTFGDETDQISKVLSEKRRPVYEENRHFLSQEIKLNYVQMDERDSRSSHLQNDTWGLINLMESSGARFILVTADQLLIERVILADKQVDIYDLSTERFRYYESFADIRPRLALDDRMTPVADDHAPIREGSVLYRKHGAPVKLAGEINSGIEGTLYKISDQSSLIAKIFKKGKLPENKLASLMYMQGINDAMEISWAIFPQDMLYFDPELTIPVGFTESYTATSSNLGEEPLYLGNILDLPDEHLDVRISQTLLLVLKIVRQVRYLNQYGFYLSDYNTMNFSFRADNYDLMQMWDTDSFSFGRYFSGFIAGDRTSKEYDVTSKLGTIDFCNESLYIFAFKMLTLGDAPISEIRGTFKYDRESYQNMFRKDMIPDNLWKLFDDVFHGRKEASTEVLLQELVTAVDNLCKNPSQDMTYLQLINAFFGEDEEDDGNMSGLPQDQIPQPGVNTTTPDIPTNGPPMGADPGLTQIEFEWGVQEPVRNNSMGWIAAILCAAAAALAFVLLR